MLGYAVLADTGPGQPPGAHGIQRFGTSAPYKQIQKELGFLPEDVVRHAEEVLGK